MSNLTFHTHNPHCEKCYGSGDRVIGRDYEPKPCDCGPTAMLTVSKEKDLEGLGELRKPLLWQGPAQLQPHEITTRLLRFAGEFDLAGALKANDPACIYCSGLCHWSYDAYSLGPCPCRKYDLAGVDAVVLEKPECNCDDLGTGPCGPCLSPRHNLAAAREALTERGVEVIDGNL